MPLKPLRATPLLFGFSLQEAVKVLANENWVQRYVLSDDVEALVPSGLLISTRLAKSLGHKIVELGPLIRLLPWATLGHPDVIAIPPVKQQVDVCAEAGRIARCKQDVQEPSTASIAA